MKEKWFFFGSIAMLLMVCGAAIRDCKYEKDKRLAKTPTHVTNTPTEIGEMSAVANVYSVWLTRGGSVFVFNGQGGAWTLEKGPITLSNGSGTKITINKETE